MGKGRGGRELKGRFLDFGTYKHMLFLLLGSLTLALATPPELTGWMSQTRLALLLVNVYSCVVCTAQLALSMPM